MVTRRVSKRPQTPLTATSPAGEQLYQLQGYLSQCYLATRIAMNNHELETTTSQQKMSVSARLEQVRFLFLFLVTALATGIAGCDRPPPLTIFEAAVSGDVKALKRNLDQGVDPNSTDHTPPTTLH